MPSFFQSVSNRWIKQRKLTQDIPLQVWVAGSMYFGYYMALGAFMPFIGLYYDRMGLSGVQIGTLSAVPVLVSTATVLFWGSIADARHWHRPILRLNLLLGGGAILLISTARSFEALIPLVMLYALITSPIVPLLDSSALEVAEASRRSYGELRLWGSVGWSIATVVVGRLIQSLGLTWLFYAYAGIIFLTFLLSLFQSKRKQTLSTPLRRGLKELLLNAPFLLFLLSIFLISVTLGAANSFFSIYLDSIGASEGAIGWGWAIAALSEIPVMLYSGNLLRRIGSSGLLKIAFVTFAIRWLLYSFIHTPTLAILTQVLHGLSFATYLVGSVTYINERAPAGLKTAAQAVFTIAAFGFGSIAGPFFGGYLYQYAGMSWLFRALSLVIVAGFALFLASQRKRPEAAPA